jgi:tryptophan-rich sensory protein
MKISLYFLAGLLTTIWAIVFFGFNSFGIVHMIIVFAAFIYIARFFFNKKLLSK